MKTRNQVASVWLLGVAAEHRAKSIHSPSCQQSSSSGHWGSLSLLCSNWPGLRRKTQSECSVTNQANFGSRR